MVSTARFYDELVFNSSHKNEDSSNLIAKDLPIYNFYIEPHCTFTLIENGIERTFNAFPQGTIWIGSR